MARACQACCSSAYAEDRRRFLLNYVQHCDDPGVIIESFLEHAPTQARSPVRSSKARHLVTVGAHVSSCLHKNRLAILP